MIKQRFLKAPLVLMCGLLVVLVMAPAAQAAEDSSVAPVRIADNPKCSEMGLATVAYFGPVSSGTVGPVTLVKHDTYYVKWNSTVAVDVVIVKGGPDGNVYTYPYDAYGDDWLHAPMNGDRPYGLSHVEFCSDGKDNPEPEPGILVTKSGPATAYVGDDVTYTFVVTNTGDSTLTDLTVEDDRCAPLTRLPQEVDTSFDPGDTWTYTCTTTITDAMGDAVTNTVEACGMDGDDKVCDEDDHKTDIPKPAIQLEKTGAATAAAGATFTYSFKATNTGNVTLTNVVLTDDKCQATLSPVPPADATLTVGESQDYTCTVVAPAGPAQVDNVAKVCGDFDADDVEPMTVCDDDPHTFTVPPPGENPPVNPPPTVTPNLVPPNAVETEGGVLPQSIVSGRAQLRGPSGCVKQAFRARVSGRSIASVTFFVDGRKVKKVGRGGAFSLKVNPSKYGLGRHKLVAVVRFRAESGTKARKLPLTFRRCAQGAVAPRFTG
jgi:hypothetical protein